MHKALYRVYRPKTFEDVVGQEHIVKTLKNLMATTSKRHKLNFEDKEEPNKKVSYTAPNRNQRSKLQKQDVSDEDAARYIKIFTSIEKDEIDQLIEEHTKAPHMRELQKRLAKEVTIMVHSEDDYNAAVKASNILFGKSTSDDLKSLDEDTFLAVFEGVPQFEINRSDLGEKALDLFVEKAEIFPSKGEMRKLVQGGGVSLNQERLESFDYEVTENDLLNNKYLLVQRGRKNYFIVLVK